MIVYLSIGNSDDKLSQRKWSEFIIAISARVASYASQIHGCWFSVPQSQWQNACWCLEFSSEAVFKEAKEVLREIRDEFNQDSIACASVTETEFI